MLSNGFVEPLESSRQAAEVFWGMLELLLAGSGSTGPAVPRVSPRDGVSPGVGSPCLGVLGVCASSVLALLGSGSVGW